ncbi:MAG: hypothetical protein IRZ07_27985, partial [Microbispora sp.]|nr:hypothetical protein [Microbispora sp.]
ALATAANAAPASTASTTAAPHHDWDYDGWWGTYYSSNHLAKARGYVDVNYRGLKWNSVHVTGKLYDQDHRTYRRGGKCAFVQFRVTSWSHAQNYKTYKYCGAGGYKKIDFWSYNAARVQAKVCQIGLYSHFPVSCGYWHDVYNAYEEKYGYDA